MIVRRTDAQYRHVILMSDGMSCCNGNYAPLLDGMHADNVTLSTIAVGGDADQDLLAQLARQGDGRYYFAEHARDIPRLPHVAAHRVQPPAEAPPLHAAHERGPRLAQVEQHSLVASREQGFGDVQADEAVAARDQHSHAASDASRTA